MSAKHAVLGLVIERPGYGYQLAQRLEERCGAWGYERSGVYRALDQLQLEKHVRSEREKGASGRGAPRVIYEPTRQGVEFFEDWISKSSPPSPFRQELDLKVLFSGAESLPALIDQTWAQEQTCIDQLRTLTSTSLMRACPPEGMSWRDAAAVLARDAEIKLLQTRIEWLQEARLTMKAILDRSVGGQRG
jgi:DNA-binding PadR family transcriptional regulator